MLLGLLFGLPALCAVAVGIFTGGFYSLHGLWILPVSYLGAFALTLPLILFLVWLAGAPVNTDKPQETDSKFYRWLMHCVIDLLLFLLPVKVHTEGLEKMPDDPQILLVCNHLHEVDPGVLMKYFPQYRLSFLAKKEVLKMPIIGKFAHKILCQSVNRENDREALKTILKCVDLIKTQGTSMGIFPEGYVYPDRKLHRFRNGVLKIAQKTKLPIVICTLRNTHKVLPNAMKLKHTDVDLHLVRVLRPEEYAGMTTVELGNSVYNIMAEDLGPENVSQNEISS